jgi:hypothetical protein
MVAFSVLRHKGLIPSLGAFADLLSLDDYLSLAGCSWIHRMPSDLLLPLRSAD